MKSLPFEAGGRAKNNKRSPKHRGRERALEPIKTSIKQLSDKLRGFAEKGDLSPEEISNVTNATRTELSRLYVKRRELGKFPHNKRSPRRRR